MTSNGSEGSLASIGKGMYLSRPIRNGQPGEPTVILLFGWMGAKLPHILKYVQAYDEMYPGAAKIVIRTDAPFFIQTTGRKRANLAPVVQALEALGCVPPVPGKGKPHQNGAPLDSSLSNSTSGILVHTFSNGGSWHLAALSSLFQDSFKEAGYPTHNLPPTAMILDSCPGIDGLEGSKRAFVNAIRNPIIRYLASALVTIFYLIATFFEQVLRFKSGFTGMKEALNREHILPYFTKKTKRLYFYSKADQLVPAAQVEAHAESARKEGFETRLEKFEDSPHVAHARTHPESAPRMVPPSAFTTTPTTVWIQRLLWAALALGCTIFAISMPIYGINSIFISPSAGLASLVFTATMLALNAVDQRRRASVQADRQEKVASVSASAAVEVRKPSKGSFIPCYSRIPSLVVAVLMTLLWIVDFGIAIYFTFWVIPNVEIGDGSVTPKKWMPASVIEIILVAVDAGVWVTFVGLCIRERRRLVRTVDGGFRELKGDQQT
ncbi:hypothetical protein MD484_g2257, partial [Candolleomyces efflorescens]